MKICVSYPVDVSRGTPMKICVSCPVDVCYMIIYTKKSRVNQNIEMLLMPPKNKRVKSDGFVKSRHSGENRSPDDLQLLEKIRQSALADFRRNDGEGGCWTFYEFIKPTLFTVSISSLG